MQTQTIDELDTNPPSTNPEPVSTMTVAQLKSKTLQELQKLSKEVQERLDSYTHPNVTAEDLEDFGVFAEKFMIRIKAELVASHHEAGVHTEASTSMTIPAKGTEGQDSVRMKRKRRTTDTTGANKKLKVDVAPSASGSSGRGNRVQTQRDTTSATNVRGCFVMCRQTDTV